MPIAAKPTNPITDAANHSESIPSPPQQQNHPKYDHAPFRWPSLYANHWQIKFDRIPIKSHARQATWADPRSSFTRSNSSAGSFANSNQHEPIRKQPNRGPTHLSIQFESHARHFARAIRGAAHQAPIWSIPAGHCAIAAEPVKDSPQPWLNGHRRETGNERNKKYVVK